MAVEEVQESSGGFREVQIASFMGPCVPPAVAADASRASLSPAGRGVRRGRKRWDKGGATDLQTPPPTTKRISLEA